MSGASTPQSYSRSNPQNESGNEGPAAKKPRLDDLPNFKTTGMGNIQLPNQIFQSPYTGPSNASPNFSKALPTFATPQTSQAASPTSAMLPPERPENRNPDLNDLGDVLFGVGVDLREEEAALMRSRAQRESTFNLARTNVYSHNLPGSRDSFYGAGNFNQTAESEQSADRKEKAQRQHALRVQAEIKQYHLNEPFLQTGILQRRLHREVQKLQLRVPGETAMLKSSQPRTTALQLRICGPDHNEILRSVKGEPLLSLQSDLVNVLSLLSLATQERLRILVEDAAILARGRRVGSQGLLPDSQVSVIAANDVAQTLQQISQNDQNAETQRLARRQKRTTAEEGLRKTGADAPMAPAMSEAATEPAKRVSAKAAKRVNTPASDAQAFAASNKTLSMQLGNIGGKRPSWLKKDTAPSNPYAASVAAAKAARPTSTPKPERSTTPQQPKGRMFGLFREDAEGLRKIHLRDLVSVLEHDGKCKKMLQIAYTRLGRSG